MKKGITIFLLFFYLIPALGISVNFHTCSNKINLVEFGASHEKKCRCKKKMPVDCCKDYHFSAKIDLNQKPTSQIIAPTNDLVKKLSTSHLVLYKILNPQFDLFDFSQFHGPPLITGVSVYLAINVFRI